MWKISKCGNAFPAARNTKVYKIRKRHMTVFYTFYDIFQPNFTSASYLIPNKVFGSIWCKLENRNSPNVTGKIFEFDYYSSLSIVLTTWLSIDHSVTTSNGHPRKRIRSDGRY